MRISIVANLPMSFISCSILLTFIGYICHAETIMTAKEYCSLAASNITPASGLYLMKVTITFALHKTGTIRCEKAELFQPKSHTFWIANGDDDPDVPNNVKDQVNSWSVEFLRTIKPVEKEVVAVLKIEHGVRKVVSVPMGKPGSQSATIESRICRSDNALFCLKILQLIIVNKSPL